MHGSLEDHFLVIRIPWLNKVITYLLMPGPQAAQILQMPHPVTEESGICPTVARGQGGGDWAQLSGID